MSRRSSTVDLSTVKEVCRRRNAAKMKRKYNDLDAYQKQVYCVKKNKHRKGQNMRAACLYTDEVSSGPKEEGKYKGRKFSSVCHFFGSQARGSLPSNFDCNYVYVLGHICVQIIAAGLNGYMATVTNLKDSTNKWRCTAVPLAAMMSVRRHLRGPGAVPIRRPVIHPSPIDLKAESYAVLREKASSFLLDDFYRTPGGIQFEGPGAGAKPITLTIEEQDYLGDIEILQAYLEKVRTIPEAWMLTGDSQGINKLDCASK